MDEVRRKIANIIDRMNYMNDAEARQAFEKADRILAMLKSEGVLKEDGDGPDQG